MNTIKKCFSSIHPSIHSFIHSSLMGSGAHLKVLVGASWAWWVVVAWKGTHKEWIETPQLLCEVQGHYASQVATTTTQLFWLLMVNDGLWNLRHNTTHSQGTLVSMSLLALPTTKAKEIVFRFIIEYSSLRDFGP